MKASLRLSSDDVTCHNVQFTVSKPCVSREVAMYVCILVALQISLFQPSIVDVASVANTFRQKMDSRHKTTKIGPVNGAIASPNISSILWQLREKAIQVLLLKQCDLSSNLGRRLHT